MLYLLGNIFNFSKFLFWFGWVRISFVMSWILDWWIYKFESAPSPSQCNGPRGTISWWCPSQGTRRCCNCPWWCTTARVYWAILVFNFYTITLHCFIFCFQLWRWSYTESIGYNALQNFTHHPHTIHSQHLDSYQSQCLAHFGHHVPFIHNTWASFISPLPHCP